MGHQGWPTKKIVGFQKSRTVQMAFNFLGFFLEYFLKYSWLLLFIKIIYGNFFLSTRVFFIKIQKIKIDPVQNKTM